jgi:hypothetical protein
MAANYQPNIIVAAQAAVLTGIEFGPHRQQVTKLFRTRVI